LDGDAAEKIPAADNDGDLTAQLMDFADLRGDLMHAYRIDAKTLIRRKGFA
jgi:hypothetical protein